MRLAVPPHAHRMHSCTPYAHMLCGGGGRAGCREKRLAWTNGVESVESDLLYSGPTTSATHPQLLLAELATCTCTPTDVGRTARVAAGRWPLAVTEPAVGPFEHGRFGAGLTISLHIAPSGAGKGKGHQTEAYMHFHMDTGFMAHRSPRHLGLLQKARKYVAKELKKL